MAIIWLNGRMLDAAEARIDPADRGLLLGDGIFETMRATGGRVPLLNRHLARLETGARLLGLPLLAVMADLVTAIAQTLAANGRLDGTVRLTLTRGPGGRGLALPETPMPTLMLVTAPLPPPRPPARLVVAKGTRRNQHSPLSRVKALGYLDAILALQEATAAGADDALLLNTADRLASATTANLFLVRDGGLRTPTLAEGALPGITRAVVLETARARRIAVTEAPVAPEEIALASEVFLTSSLVGLRSVAAVDGRAVGNGRAGTLTSDLQAAWLGLQR